jgi:hypothetical protein
MIRQLSTEHGQSRSLRRLWLANAALCLLLAQSGRSENLAVSPP